MAQRDIVVRRVSGARAVLPPVGAPVIIPAVICRSLGKKTTHTFNLTRDYGVSLNKYFDKITSESGVKSPIASFSSAVWKYNFDIGKEEVYNYRAGVHFRIAKLDESGKIIEYLNTENLYLDELFYSNGNPKYAIDWSQAPLLSAPIFEVSVGGSGNIPAGVYKVHLYAKSNEPAGHLGASKTSQSIVKEVRVVGQGKSILVTWKKVAYATGYILKIYDENETLKVCNVYTPDVFSVSIDSFPSNVVDITCIPGAKQVPGSDANYSVEYKYYEKFTNKPVLYATLDQVAEDHGIGSEAYNIARLMLSPEYGGAPFVEIVAVDEDSPAGYQQALETLKDENVHLIFATYWDTNLFFAMYQHALTLSDPITGQRERYVVFAHQNGWEWYSNEVKNFLESFRALEGKGKRGFFVIFDGGEITLDSWIEIDGSVTRDKKVVLQTGEDITPIFGAMIAFARYCSFRDPASSLTEKNVPGISFVKKSWGDDVYFYLRDKGAFVVRNDRGSAIVDLDINMSYNLLGLNDAQLPICVTEDWMKQDLRNKLKIFRGKKNVEVPLISIVNYLKLILDNYVMARLITSYDESSIKVEILSSGLLKGYFKYTPVIIINQILFEYDFEFIV